jgi:diacylglycerol kinase (ATP)
LGVKADEKVIADRFILIAVMNMKLIGPSLCLAPDCDPGDGYLDLICVRERYRQDFCRWLEDQTPWERKAANFEHWRCRRVEARASNLAAVHVDSHLLEKPDFPLIIELKHAALKYAVVKGGEEFSAGTADDS